MNVIQDPGITELMGNYKVYNEKNKTVDGFRLQIMFSNNRDDVYAAKTKLYKDFPSENCYVTYEQPNYKLRLGDFADRFAAYKMLNEILPLYPSAFVVKEQVQP
ncbi:MAG TPA: SPOR domain-containing protein [Chitinophagales bacterium]